MGRKSRRVAITPAQQTSIRPNIFPTAIYVRLSVENSGKDDDGAAIENQIEICKEYVKNSTDLELVKVYEDNGFTGTNMIRPAFEEMWRDIDSGIIKAIIVRDLSRYSRDYIETGRHLEKLFPEKDIRFISVKENFDTFKTDGTAESLMIPLQTLINDFYSKDISRKVETALRAQMAEGTFKYRRLPYGYMWDETNTEIIPDPDRAGYVKKIYDWKLDGLNQCQIRRKLESEGAPLYMDGKLNKRKEWAVCTIKRILTDPFYIGHEIYGKNHSAIYKGIKREKLSLENCVVKEYAHEPLVSEDVFYKVKEQMDEVLRLRKQSMERTAKIRSELVDHLPCKVYCSVCGRKMHYVRSVQKRKNGLTSYTVYTCNYNVNGETRGCPGHTIKQDDLDDIVLKTIKNQIRTAIDFEEFIEKFKDSYAVLSIKKDIDKSIRETKQKISKIQSIRTRLYEDYVEGILNEEEYLYTKASYEKDYNVLNDRMDNLIGKKKEFCELFSPENRWVAMMKNVRCSKKLTKELADAVIDRVDVAYDNSLEITFRYHDIYVMTSDYRKRIEEGESYE